MVEKKAVVYFLLNYLETSRRVFDNESKPLELKSRYINFKDNLQNESGTDVVFDFGIIPTMCYFLFFILLFHIVV
jgi:hypothetical protein